MQRPRESVFQAEGAACTKALRLGQPVQGEGGERGRGETSEAAAGQWLLSVGVSPQMDRLVERRGFLLPHLGSLQSPTTKFALLMTPSMSRASTAHLSPPVFSSLLCW